MPTTSGRLFLKTLKWLMHPVVVFVTLQVIWLAITLMWVIWFSDAIHEIAKIAKVAGSSYFDNHYALIVLIAGCILLGLLFFGTVLLFVTSQRQTYLMLQQKSFVSSVTHELRSPLASLQLTFETLRTRQLDASTSQKLMEMAMEDIERLARLVSHILVSSRLDRGIAGFSDEARPLNLKELILKVAQQAKWLDATLMQRLQLHVASDLHLCAPEPVLALILGNLLENALKYSPKGSPIQIRVSQTPTGLLLAVEDQGFGLSAGERKRIFRVFHRGFIAQKKAVPGTGLGLYIVKSLVHSLAGQVWAESPGRDLGSTFFVAFPSGLVSKDEQTLRLPEGLECEKVRKHAGQK